MLWNPPPRSSWLCVATSSLRIRCMWSCYMLLHLRFAYARARAQRAANSTCTRCERAREIERLPPTPKMPKTQTKKSFSTFEAEKISQNLSEAKASSKIQETYKESTIFEFFEGGGGFITTSFGLGKTHRFARKYIFCRSKLTRNWGPEEHPPFFTKKEFFCWIS